MNTSREMELREEIDALRVKIKNLRTDFTAYFDQSSARIKSLTLKLEDVAQELFQVEGTLRRGMPIHADYIKELRESLNEPERNV